MISCVAGLLNVRIDCSAMLGGCMVLFSFEQALLLGSENFRGQARHHNSSVHGQAVTQRRSAKQRPPKHPRLSLDAAFRLKVKRTLEQKDLYRENVSELLEPLSLVMHIPILLRQDTCAFKAKYMSLTASPNVRLVKYANCAGFYESKRIKVAAQEKKTSLRYRKAPARALFAYFRCYY